MIKDDIKSIYIHIPFCNNICSYCDFCKIYYKEDLALKYLEALKYEIDKRYNKEIVNTLYIGGGTPSSLSKNALNKLFKIIKNIKLNKDYEFTFECNVEDINISLLETLRKNRVNRLSIGVESFNKKNLKFLNRNYTISINKKIMLAKKYFTNINIDLIYALSNESIRVLKQDLKKFIKLDIPHISIYSLILEEHTKLKNANVKPISYDLDRKMYDLICKYLKAHGYIHYEISNFSREGFLAKHNLTYWNNEKYYGFGLGASGYIKNYRYTNTRSFNKYLLHKFIIEKEKITKKIDMENTMILGLRKLQGVAKKDFYNKYHKNIDKVFTTKNLKENQEYYYISEENLYISNYILKDFIN